tara:strand:+ start:556 stop:2016 length:1461 start_codon:yes stop_codon:yes gene_type:complete
MKSFKKVQEDRIAYHRDPSKFSVHRSSLLIPIVNNYDAIISFLNHFLIKRNNKSVSIKLSAYGTGGKLKDTYFEEISEKRVYEFNLSNIFSNIADLKSFQAEFFSSKNLFIPFPAVIVQHKSKNSKNIIHSYNRILNDADEDIKINSNINYESSFEAIKTQKSCTCFIFHTGQEKIRGRIRIEIFEGNKKKIFYESVNLPAFSSKIYSLKKYLKTKDQFYFCRILQPRQKMFFGRILVGSFSNKYGFFTANHSYYDSSNLNENFNNSVSYRQYPYFHNFQNTIKFYPINGKSNLAIYIKVGNIEYFAGNIISPSSDHLDVNVNMLLNKNKIKSDTYTVIAKSMKKIPTRVNHQLIIGKFKSDYNSSINVSLLNEEIYKPNNKKSYIWGMTQYDKKYDTVLHILGKHPTDESKCKLSLYSEQGLIFSKKVHIKPSQKITLNNDFCKKLKIKNDNTLWYSVESNSQNLQAFTVTSNNKSGVSSGEHNF